MNNLHLFKTKHYQTPPLVMMQDHGEQTRSKREKLEGKLRIAVCMAGQARTLAHPAVWRSAYEHLLERGKHDLYAVLGTGSEGASFGDGAKQGSNQDQALGSACGLEEALNALRPIKTLLVLQQPVKPPCAENFATMQFLSWAGCAKLIPKGRYDYIFKTRPDVYWTPGIAHTDKPFSGARNLFTTKQFIVAHVGLSSMAAHLALGGKLDVVTHNDWHMLIHDSQLHVLAGFRNVSCAGHVCNRCKRCLFRDIFDDYNEYCVLMNHFAIHKIRQIESRHPEDPRMYGFASNQIPWLQSLKLGKLARWSPESEPPQQPRGVRLVCWPGRTRLAKCEYCIPGTRRGNCPPHVIISRNRSQALTPERHPIGQIRIGYRPNSSMRYQITTPPASGHEVYVRVSEMCRSKTSF